MLPGLENLLGNPSRVSINPVITCFVNFKWLDNCDFIIISSNYSLKSLHSEFVDNSSNNLTEIPCRFDSCWSKSYKKLDKSELLKISRISMTGHFDPPTLSLELGLYLEFRRTIRNLYLPPALLFREEKFSIADVFRTPTGVLL